MKNIIDDLLDYLEVKHTTSFVKKLFDEHPHNENMYGLQDMLKSYNIECVGVNVKEKDKAHLLFPSIYHIDKNFVIAVDSNDKEISLWKNGKIVTSNINKFKRIWDGNVLVITSTENAEEKNYRYNLGLEWITNLSWGSLFLCPLVILIILLSYNPVATKLSYIPILLLDILGSILSYLLLQKKWKEESSIGDKFCSMITEKGCDAVLSSQKSTVLYLYSWSEIGLAYFITNLMLASIAPQLMAGLILINYVAMAYGIWSVCYQAVIVKKWCSLCLSVQLTIWLLGIYYSTLMYHDIIVLSNIFVSLSVAAFSILLAIIIVHFVVKSYYDNFVITSLQRKMKVFQVDNDVLKAKYTKEEKCSNATSISSIFWGNQDALQQITIVMNPLCSHCSKQFKKIEPLLQKENLKLGIRVVFLSFGSGYDDACKFFIAAYQELGKDKALEIYSKWFSNISQDINQFILSTGININHNSVINEYSQHKQWASDNHINRTPYVLVNGHILPSIYEINDLEEMDEI
jgi:hypothetical protein